MVDTLKKIVLSLSVVVLFALYAFQEKYRETFGSPAVSAGQVATATPRVASSLPTRPPATEPPSTDVPSTATRRPQTKTPSVPQPSATATATAKRAAPTRTAVPTRTATTEPSPTADDGLYLDGTYTGSVADAHWGDVEVEVEIVDGQISDVTFLTYPDHRSRSRSINDRAMPVLIREAISSQSADVDVVTGATDTSDAFIESLSAALDQAVS